MAMDIITRVYKNLITYEYDIPYKELAFLPAAFFSGLGYAKVNAPQYLYKILNEIIVQMDENNQIKGGFVLIPHNKLAIESNHIKCFEQKFYPGRIILKQLKDSESLALFLVTAGNKIGLLCKEAFKNEDSVKAYITDAFGSYIAELAADLMHQQIAKLAIKKGWQVTNRFSPGYCGWSVKEQHILFSFFPAEFCNVKLYESSIMEPLKSVSGIIGMGKEVTLKQYPCKNCAKKNCIKSMKYYKQRG